MINLNNPETAFALDAVRRAALLVKHIQAEMVTSALTKDDRSPVTVADFAAQALVGHLLEEKFPGVSLVGEESSAVLQIPEERDTLLTITRFLGEIFPQATPEKVCAWIDRGAGEAEDRYWTVDPIDGTKGFLRGAQYAVALALVVDGQPQIGVLGCPNLTGGYRENVEGEGSLLIAATGEGSWLTALEGGPQNEFTRVKVSPQDDPAQARLLRSFESGHTNTGQVDRFNQAMGGEAPPVRMDSQAKYAVLASGQGEIYLRLLSPGREDYREKVWDQAAGSLIVEAAGGRVTDLAGNPLDFSVGRRLLKNRGVCATNGHLHEAALQALRTVKAV
ncbi:MAG: Fructose-1,6-bisphosphatase/inositol-1-monophosphatase [Chloroflexi bacterium]|nr:Fructose-1,6-bisphosphatase/inositol-1-monophosphatase [Chloroflexota bacterium]